MATVCVPLTTTQKNALQEAGVVLGAGYASQAECEAECGGTIVTGCCGGIALPTTLYCTLTNAIPPGCRDNGSVPLVWNGTGWAYLDVGDSACDSFGVLLTCNGTTFDVSNNGAYCGPDPALWTGLTPSSCSPFILSNNDQATNSCGKIILDITE